MALPPRPDADPTPRDGGWPVTLAVDPEDPIHRAFIRQELLRGTIRTIPDGPGRLRILPLPPRGLAGRRSPWGG